MPNLQHMNPAEREKHLKKIIEVKRNQRGTADKALKTFAHADVPLPAKDELVALRKELHGVKHDDQADIDHLRKRLKEVRHHIAEQAHKHSGPGAAVQWAVSQNGVTESPAGSNWGHPVEDWEQFTGYTSPVSWCGCFVCVAVVEHGGASIPAKIRLGYGPAIIADAHAHANDLVAVEFEKAIPGDILVYWGGEHIGLVRNAPSGSSINTVEGNTSPVVGSGSEYNGGCVALKTRSQSDVTVVARPNY